MVMHKRDRGFAPNSKSTRFAPAQRQLVRRISAAVRLQCCLLSRRSSACQSAKSGSSTDVVGEACRWRTRTHHHHHLQRVATMRLFPWSVQTSSRECSSEETVIELNPDDLISFRPISNLSFLSKIIEPVVMKQFIHPADQNELLPVSHLTDDSTPPNQQCRKLKKNSGEGAVPPPQTPALLGRGHPLPKFHPLGACGASTLAPSALDICPPVRKSWIRLWPLVTFLLLLR